MKWIDKFAESIDRFAGENVRKEVMKSSEKLISSSNPSKKAEWIKGAMERLDASVNKETMKKIMIETCPHTYPKGRIQKLQRKYKQLGNIDELLEIMRDDSSWKGRSYYDNPVRNGSIIYVTKVPCNPEAYQNAKTEHEKQLAYCHCPWIRATISIQEKISPIFCYCATAWDKQLWEGIFEKSVRIEVIKSLLQGDDCCIHAISIPSEVLNDEGTFPKR